MIEVNQRVMTSFDQAEAEQLKRQRDPSDDRSELKVVEEELMKVGNFMLRSLMSCSFTTG